jgi:hypothetical protein
MTCVRVDPRLLEALARGLVEASAAAAHVRDRGGDLAARASAEHALVRTAIRSFVDRWAYGCGCLVDDATQTSVRLTAASGAYRHLEAALSAGLGHEVDD